MTLSGNVSWLLHGLIKPRGIRAAFLQSSTYMSVPLLPFPQSVQRDGASQRLALRHPRLRGGSGVGGVSAAAVLGVLNVCMCSFGMNVWPAFRSTPVCPAPAVCSTPCLGDFSVSDPFPGWGKFHQQEKREAAASCVFHGPSRYNHKPQCIFLGFCGTD